MTAMQLLRLPLACAECIDFSRADSQELAGISNELKEKLSRAALELLRCQQPTTSFSAHPIGTIATLARMLKFPIPDLQHIAATADDRYRIGKKNSRATVLSASAMTHLGSKKHPSPHPMPDPHLVRYPIYLQGSIRDSVSPAARRPTQRCILANAL